MRRLLAASCLGLLLVLPAAAQAAPRKLLHEGSEIAFSVTQMGVKVSGRFERFDARIDWVAEDPAKSSAEITVEIGSLSTGDAEADGIALDKPWLDRAGFPQAHFRSKSLRRVEGSNYEVTGALTIRGRERPLKLPLAARAKEGGALTLEGEFAILRSDFGIGGGEWNEGDIVANSVPVHVRLQLAPP